MMNADGSNLIQVTDSDQQEVSPVFSPDGKYLLVGANCRVTGPWGRLWDLCILPVDGQKHNVNQKADKQVVFLTAKGQSAIESSDGNMIWR